MLARQVTRALALAAVLLLQSFAAAAQGLIAQLPIVQVFDNSGNILSGGKLNIYAAGTTTRLTTYSDSALTIPNANPVVLTGAGRFPNTIYLQALSYKFILTDANDVTVWSADNVPGGYAASVIVAGTVATARLGSGTANSTTFLRGDSTWASPSTLIQLPPPGRLTLTSGTPVTTSDVTAATTLYYSPYTGGQIRLWNNGWIVDAMQELSITVPATTSQMYDVFVYDNSGAPTLELTAWTNDTTRATGLTRTISGTNYGTLVKSGDATRLYLGSFRTTTVSGQTEDSATKRYVWNMYNRRPRPLLKREATNQWGYTIATVRQANGSTANQVDVVVGVAETSLSVQLTVTTLATGNVNLIASIGEDSTTTVSSNAVGGQTSVNNAYTCFGAQLTIAPAIGRHFYAWLEYSTATGTTTWYSGASSFAVPNMGSGLSGWIEG